jgi:hypothetical protein
MRWLSDHCLICSGQQELVIGVRERGPYEAMHDYTRVLFCRACDVGELRSFSYDGFVVHGEEDDVMVWSSVIASADVDLLRSSFACALPLAHVCECAQHVRAHNTSLSVQRTKLEQYGPDRHSPAGRTTASVRVTGGLAEFC